MGYCFSWTFIDFDLLFEHTFQNPLLKMFKSDHLGHFFGRSCASGLLGCFSGLIFWV